MDRVKPGYNNRQSWGKLPRINLPKLLRKPPRASPTREPEEPIAVICVCVGPKFPAHYVFRLRQMVARNLSYDHQFFCVTDRPGDFGGIGSGIHVLAPGRPLTGWYSKINLFNPENFDAGVRVLYFDLDVVIRDSIDDFVRCPEPFVMIREFNAKPEAAHNSSIMSWLTPFTDACFYMPDDWTERSWGDQECIWTMMGNDSIWDWPEEFVQSYKYHCAGGRAPTAPVVVFHGDPKQDAVNDAWVKEHWR